MTLTFLECIKWLYNSDWRGVNLQQTTSTIYKRNEITFISVSTYKQINPNWLENQEIIFM